LFAIQRPTWSKISDSLTHTPITHRGGPWTGLEHGIQGIYGHRMRMTHYLIV
jgi:hypothetical protein